MNLELQHAALNDLSTPLLAVPVFQDEPGQAFDRVNQSLDGLAATLCEEEDFKGKPGSTLLIHRDSGAAIRRVLLVGLGKSSAFKSAGFRALSCAAVQESNKRRLSSATCMLPSGVAADRLMRFGVEGALLGGYSYTKWLSQDVTENTLSSLSFLDTDGRHTAADLGRFQAITAGVNFARDLVNGPPSEVDPAYLANVATEIAAESGLELEIFEEDELVKRGMDLIMAVGTGSVVRPRLIHLTYRPDNANDDTPSIAFVGKGVTFDAGGYNIKPTGSMEDMKMDMAGAATVLGLMKVINSVAPNTIVHGIVPTVENLVSRDAYKPGDIYRAMNGKSVEIMNTDAEGRLILADALCYADGLGPDRIIDLATLTGACVVALGPNMAAIFSNDDDFAAEIKSAADHAGEDMWHMPLAKKLRPMLKSKTADMKNIGARWGGAITAALFLEEFIGERTWAHLDIAGPAFSDKAEGHIPAGGTGFGVLTLVQLLEGEAN